MKFGYTGAGTAKISENGNLKHLYKQKMTEQQAKDYVFKTCTEADHPQNEADGNIYAWEAYENLVECARNGLYGSSVEG